jgi:hypothetical protein
MYHLPFFFEHCYLSPTYVSELICYFDKYLKKLNLQNMIYHFQEERNKKRKDRPEDDRRYSVLCSCFY